MIRNPLPLLIIAALAVIAAYTFFFVSAPAVNLHYPSEDKAERLCSEGQIRNCTVGGCTGVSTCASGRWGGCKWEMVCTPGIRAPCLNNSCVYAYKECNECGTGYGPCEAAEKCC